MAPDRRVWQPEARLRGTATPQLYMAEVGVMVTSARLIQWRQRSNYSHRHPEALSPGIPSSSRCVCVPCLLSLFRGNANLKMGSQVQWCDPLIPALRRQRPAHLWEFNTVLGCIVRHFFFQNRRRRGEGGGGRGRRGSHRDPFVCQLSGC